MPPTPVERHDHGSPSEMNAEPMAEDPVLFAENIVVFTQNFTTWSMSRTMEDDDTGEAEDEWLGWRARRGRLVARSVSETEEGWLRGDVSETEGG